MGRLQIFDRSDKLRDIKMEATEFLNITFAEHPINEKINIGSGSKNGIVLEEQILTDGTISIERNNKTSPSIVLLNNYIKLDEGLSISISLQKASFYINIIKCGNIIQYDVHTEKESKELLNHILQFISLDGHKEDSLSSITLKYPGFITIKNYINGKVDIDTIDFYNKKETGRNKTKKKKHY